MRPYARALRVWNYLLAHRGDRPAPDRRVRLAVLPLEDRVVPAAVQVNSYGTGPQQAAAVAVAPYGSGNRIVVWQSSNQDGSSEGIYAQRYGPDGAALGAEFRVNTTTAGSQFAPSVGMDAGGNFVVAWTSANQDGSGNGVYARRYDAAGVPLSGEFRVNTYWTNAQQNPAVGVDASGNFVVAWESLNQDGSGNGVYAQRYASTGTAAGTEFRVSTYTVGAQFAPAVAVDGSGNFIVAWDSQRVRRRVVPVRLRRRG